MRRLIARDLHLVIGLLVLLGAWDATGATPASTNTVFDERARVFWQKGPATAKLKQTATVNLIPGVRFADAHSTMRLLRAGNQTVTEREMGMILPEDGTAWSIVFMFDEIGYMNDSGANSLDLTDLLEKLNRQAQAEHAQRKIKGAAPRVTWEQKPAYKMSNHTLDWVVRSETANLTNLQYQARFLGRKGVMSVSLEGDFDQVSPILPAIKEMMGTFAYYPGERYSDIAFRDRLARGNMEGLITGKAATQGSKLGFVAGLLLLLKKLMKLLLTVVIIAAIAGAAWAGYFFYKIYYGRGKSKSEPAG